MVVNPSCEHIMLEPNRKKEWRNATLDTFADAGFKPVTGQFPPRLRGTTVKLRGNGVAVVGKTAGAESRWELSDCPAHVLNQVRHMSGIAVALTTATLPTRLGADDLRSAFSTPGTLAGWASLD